MGEQRPDKPKGVLGKIEYWGNKMPHPLLLFTYLLGIVFILSFIMSRLDRKSVV